MKKLLFVLFAGLLILASCNEEPAIEPNAEFTFDLVDNTAFAGETFYIYLDNCRGDFFALYRGLTPSTTYTDTATTQGEAIDTDTDSVAITYNNKGEYKLTFIASSSGNWAEEYKTDIYSQVITVIDSRTGFSSVEAGGRVGQITSENEILFYAHKNEDISRERIRFITMSPDANVTVNGEDVSSGRFNLDFSAVNPGDDEGRSHTFRVEAPNGESEEYTAKFILRDPNSDKRLFALSSSDLSAEFTIDEENKEVLVSYYEGESLEGGLLADASPGATVIAGEEEIQEDEEDVNLAETAVITVIAEDLSEQDYNIVLYEKERITGFKFVQYVDEGAETPINPVLVADVNFEARTIDMEVPTTLPLDSITSEVEGITDFTVQIEGTTLVSGVTQYDYSFDGEETSKDFEVKVFDGSALIDTYILKVHY